MLEIEKVSKNEGGTSGLTTGFQDLNSKLAGLHPTDLVILAARPSMGKTSLATNIAYNAATKPREERDAEGKKAR